MLYQLDVNFRTHTSKLTHVQALAMSSGGVSSSSSLLTGKAGRAGAEAGLAKVTSTGFVPGGKATGGGTDDAAGGPGGSGAGSTPAAHINTQNDH